MLGDQVVRQGGPDVLAGKYLDHHRMAHRRKEPQFSQYGLIVYRVLSGLVLQRIAVMHRVQICVYGVPPGTVWACGPATQLRDTRLDLPWGSIREGQVKWSLRPRTGLCPRTFRLQGQ